MFSPAASTAASSSSHELIPDESRTGLPVAAAARTSSRFVTSPEPILYRAVPSASRRSSASSEKGAQTNSTPEASQASFTRPHWSSVKAVLRKYSQRLSCVKYGGEGASRVVSAAASWSWNLTASTPASAATSIMRTAFPRLPSWFMPASATT